MLPDSTSDAAVPAAGTMESSPFIVEPNILVSDRLRFILQWILYGFLLTTISSFGVASNIINIICFVRQGLKDPVNVSLLGLAISDTGSLVTSLCSAIGINPALQILDLPVEMMDFIYLVFAPPHFVFTGATAWITCLVTLERCLCIAMPVKVKDIITSKRITVIIACIFTLFIVTASPVYFVSKLSWTFSPMRNRTTLRLVYTDDRTIMEHIYFSVNNALIPFTAYFMLIICTFTLVVNLRNKAKWRMTCVSVANVDNTSRRDQKVTRMVSMISILFIVCFSPLCVTFILMTILPEMALDGPNQNLLFVVGGTCVVLESANSAANIFIYYHMSTRYRLAFQKLFWCGNIHTKTQMACQ